MSTFDIWAEKVKIESTASLKKIIREGKELLVNKKKLNNSYLKKGDMLQDMVDAAVQELAKR